MLSNRNGSAAVLRTSPLCRSPVWIELSVNCGTVEDVKRRIRAHLEAGATRVALRPVHANGDCAARDAVLKVMTDF